MLLLTRTAAPPPRRQPRPQSEAADSAMQAAVRARLNNMLADSISDICRTVFRELRSVVGCPGRPKQVQVELLMANHVLLAMTPDAPDMQPDSEPYAIRKSFQELFWKCKSI